jgi:hypothetical protein
MSTGESIHVIEEEWYWPFKEDPVREELEKALLKLPIKDGSVELYDVLQVVKQVFDKE